MNDRRIRLAVAMGVLLPLLGIGTVLWWHWPRPEDAIEDRVPGSDGGLPDHPLRFVIGSMVSPVSTLSTYQDLLDLIGRDLGIPVTMVQRRSYQESNELLRQGQADAGWICTGAYGALAATTPLRLLAAPVAEEAPQYHAWVIVREDSPAHTLEDLRDRSFAFVDPLSLTGRAFLLMELRRRGLDPRRFFRMVRYSGSHDRSIDWVLDGAVEGATVDSLVVEQMRLSSPERISRLRVVLASEPFPAPPLVARAGLDPLIADRLEDTLTRLHERPETAAVLHRLGLRRFVKPGPSSYQAIVEAMALLQEEGLP